MSSIIINGEISDLIDINDRGLQYGDGLFETIAIKNHKLLMWHQHLDRLSHGCEVLGLPEINAQQWLEDIRALNLKDSNAVIKLIVTRGPGGRGYLPPESSITTRIVMAHPWPAYSESCYTQGIKSIFCKTTATINSTLAGLKHLNKLENVLARSEWRDDTTREGLMFDDDGHVIEGTMSNIFSVNNNTLYTPLLNKSGVKGIVREHIIRLAHELDIEFQEANINSDILLNMDEIFVTNSLIGIWPVSELNNKYFKVGKVTTLLMKNLDMTSGAQEF